MCAGGESNSVNIGAAVKFKIGNGKLGADTSCFQIDLFFAGFCLDKLDVIVKKLCVFVWVKTEIENKFGIKIAVGRCPVCLAVLSVGVRAVRSLTVFIKFNGRIRGGLWH